MARPYRIQYEGACYHVVVRGNTDVQLFRNQVDRTRFLSMLEESVMKHGVLLHAFYLNKSRVELVVETPSSNLSAFLQGCQTAYAQYYRKKYNFVGQIVRDRFRSKVIDKQSVLLPLTRHVHLLGVSERMAKKKTLAVLRKELKGCCTSYLSYTVPTKGYAFVHTSDVLKLVKRAGGDYGKYVEQAFADRDSAFQALMEVSPVAIGGDEFLAEIESIHARFLSGRKPAKLSVYGQKRKGLSKKKVFDTIAADLKIEKEAFFTQSKKTSYRAIAAYMLHRYAGMTQAAVAQALQLKSGAAVSLQIRKINQQIQHEPAMAKTIARLCRKLEK